MLDRERLVVESTGSDVQARVVVEKVKQLGCWPDDFALHPIEHGAHKGDVYLEAGLAKGRPRCLRIDLNGRTTT